MAKGNLAEEIARLKNQNGRDIAVIGGSGFAASLIKEDLIDEYHLIINPTAIGSGMPIFNLFDRMRRFTPVAAKNLSWRQNRFEQ